MSEFKAPAGEYFIGDLCHVFSDGDWERVCSVTIDEKLNEVLNGGFEFTRPDGSKVSFFMFSTLVGDGSYQSVTDTILVAVDSGTIGCTLVSNIEPEILSKFREDNEDQFVVFEEEFTVDGDSEAIRIGDVVFLMSDSVDDGSNYDQYDESDWGLDDDEDEEDLEGLDGSEV